MLIDVGESSTSVAGKVRVLRNPAVRIRQAVRDNNVSFLQRLSAKADLRNTDRNRLTSLSWAAVEGSLEVFEWLLLDYGHDDLELSRDSDNNTLLHLLAAVPSSQPTSLPYSSLFPPLPPSSLPSPEEQSRRSIQMTNLYHTLFPFLIDWSNSGGKTPMHIAAQCGNSPFVSLLLSFGADPDLTDLQGNTPLHYAAAWGHLDVARVLLEEGGAAWGIRNFEGFNAADYAYSNEIRLGMESSWESVRGVRTERRRAEMEGDMYEGDGVPPKVNQIPGGGVVNRAGNRWRSGSTSTATSWIGSNSGASGGSNGASNSTGRDQGDYLSSQRPAISRAGGSSRSTQFPPINQYPRRQAPVTGQPSPPVSDSGFATPKYDPNTNNLSRQSSQSQLQTLLRSRSSNPSLTPTPLMSRLGSGQNVTGETSNRSSPVASPRVPRPPLLAPQIHITPQPTSPATSETPSEYRYDQPARASPSEYRPFPTARSPHLPSKGSGGRELPRDETAARPTAAGPPVSAPMVSRTSSAGSGLPVPQVEGIRRSNSAQVGLGLAVGRGQLGGRI